MFFLEFWTEGKAISTKFDTVELGNKELFGQPKIVP